MAEAAGLAIGILGLAGLFTACTDCLETVQLGRSYAHNFEILQCQFEAQKVRFLCWGEVFGFGQGSGYDTRLDHPTARPVIVRILNNIQRLLSDEKAITKKYGMRKDDPNGRQLYEGRVVFAETYARFQARLKRNQARATFTTKAKWAIADRDKFLKLVQDLKELIDALDDISGSLKLLERRDDLIAAEVASIQDPGSLKMLEEVFEDNEKFSDTASRKLKMLREASHFPASLSLRSTEEGATISSDVASFRTAPTEWQPSHTGSRDAALPDSHIGSKNSLTQNQRIALELRSASLNIASISGDDSKTSAMVPLPNRRPSPVLSQCLQVDLGTAERTFSRLREHDKHHTKAVIEKHALDATPEQRRMVMILQELLDSRPTDFVSLAPLANDLLQLLGRIEGPPDTPYEGGIFHVQISIPEDFPFAPPVCRFLTRIYHPNIDATGKICLECLDVANWRMELMYLESILISISALLDQPNVDDPLVPEIAATYIQDREQFEDIARQYTSKYAQGTAAINIGHINLPQTATSNWKADFLRDRLRIVQMRTTTLIQFLQQGSVTMQLSHDAVRSSLNALYELTIELNNLAHTQDLSPRGTASSSNGQKAIDEEELEIFFDACLTAYTNLIREPEWIASFPQLRTFKNNDSTRGTGSADLFEVLENDRNDEGIAATKVLKTFKSLMNHAKFIRGEKLGVSVERRRMEPLWSSGDSFKINPQAADRLLKWKSMFSETGHDDSQGLRLSQR